MTKDLYMCVDEKLEKVINITDAEITPEEVQKTFYKPKDFEFTIETNMNSKKFICAVFGISNNYLKLHGQPMLRRWE